MFSEHYATLEPQARNAARLYRTYNARISVERSIECADLETLESRWLRQCPRDATYALAMRGVAPNLYLGNAPLILWGACTGGHSGLALRATDCLFRNQRYSDRCSDAIQLLAEESAWYVGLTQHKHVLSDAPPAMRAVAFAAAHDFTALDRLLAGGGGFTRQIVLRIQLFAVSAGDLQCIRWSQQQLAAPSTTFGAYLNALTEPSRAVRRLLAPTVSAAMALARASATWTMHSVALAGCTSGQPRAARLALRLCVALGLERAQALKTMMDAAAAMGALRILVRLAAECATDCIRTACAQTLHPYGRVTNSDARKREAAQCAEFLLVCMHVAFYRGRRLAFGAPSRILHMRAEPALACHVLRATELSKDSRALCLRLLRSAKCDRANSSVEGVDCE